MRLGQLDPGAATFLSAVVKMSQKGIELTACKSNEFLTGILGCSPFRVQALALWPKDHTHAAPPRAQLPAPLPISPR
jgi:hypothetical protein